jgi:hypothetical protein
LQGRLRRDGRLDRLPGVPAGDSVSQDSLSQGSVSPAPSPQRPPGSAG